MLPMLKAVYRRSAPPHGIRVERSRGLALQPPHGHVRVKVVCAGVNPVDAKGLWGDKLPASLAWLGPRLVEGCGVGFDFSGVVESVGCGVSNLAVGDSVFGTTAVGAASLAERCDAPVHQVAHKPEHLSYTEAAALPLAGLTALQAFRENGLRPGSRVLLIGASGGVGHIAVQVAKAMGCASVTAVCSAAGAGLALRSGADRIVDYSKGPRTMLMELQKLGPFDYCLDTVTSSAADDLSAGYPALVSRAGILNAGTRYVTIGGPFSDWCLAGIRRLARGLVDPFPRNRSLFWVNFPRSDQQLDELAALSVRPVVAHEWPFDGDNVNRAMQALLGRRVKGKIVLRVHPDP